MVPGGCRGDTHTHTGGEPVPECRPSSHPPNACGRRGPTHAPHAPTPTPTAPPTSPTHAPHTHSHDPTPSDLANELPGVLPTPATWRGQLHAAGPRHPLRPPPTHTHAEITPTAPPQPHLHNTPSAVQRPSHRSQACVRPARPHQPPASDCHGGLTGAGHHPRQRPRLTSATSSTQGPSRGRAGRVELRQPARRHDTTRLDSAPT